MDIEKDIFFDMDISVPLGIIINELVSNSLKYAFSGRDKEKSELDFTGRNVKVIHSPCPSQTME